MGRVVLVTGTDTGVGKTWIACALARALRAAGATVGVRKPAETGCAEVPPTEPDRGAAGASAAGAMRARAGESLWAADAAALREAAGATEDLAAVCAYRFAEPLAPAIAARRAGVAIDVTAIAAECRRCAAEVDVLLVEGAGGLLVPLGEGTSFADLASALSAELVIVVGARLGAINHALLTIEAARARGLTVLGLVVNHFSATRDLATDTLRAALEEHAVVPFLAEVRYGEEATAALARAAAALTGARA